MERGAAIEGSEHTPTTKKTHPPTRNRLKVNPIFFSFFLVSMPYSVWTEWAGNHFHVISCPFPGPQRAEEEESDTITNSVIPGTGRKEQEREGSCFVFVFVANACSTKTHCLRVFPAAKKEIRQDTTRGNREGNGQRKTMEKKTLGILVCLHRSSHNRVHLHGGCGWVFVVWSGVESVEGRKGAKGSFVARRKVTCARE